MMTISEDDYQRHLEATQEMSVAELGDFVRGTLGVAPPDYEPGWYVRVDFVDTAAGPTERFTWQRTLRQVIAPKDVNPNV
ncbi:hypothetical protein [Glycomyces dulcitolivorans]|uniref:hypothetical protein n=1 Tax=Glycomyces dulcitolivorans TaxID=2200759 RepID=UPI001E530DFE|nr:hypothetical protein [Glycomyces dulcitolivorans]